MSQGDKPRPYKRREMMATSKQTNPPLWRLSLWVRFGALLCLCASLWWGGCARECLPGCGPGYLCKDGQCELDPNGGRAKAIRCPRYCAYLSECTNGQKNATTCESTECNDLSTMSENERDFWVRFYECQLAATCEEIDDYLGAKGNYLREGYLWRCIGCLEDTHCPGGYRCDTTKRSCLLACKGQNDCRNDAGYQCKDGKCQK